MTLIVAIPDSSLAEASDLREKTIKAGRIARALAVFCVDKVIVYETGDDNQRDRDLLLTLLRYMDTPQYLRRRVFPISPRLKYAGMLPPLRTRGHPLGKRVSDLTCGEIRWGIAVSKDTVDIGVDVMVRYAGTASKRVPTLFRIVETEPDVKIERVERSEAEAYIGYEVEMESNLIHWLQTNHETVRIVFSRKGTPFAKVERGIQNITNTAKNIVGVFGGPRRGVMDIFANQKDALRSNVEYWVNVVPNQGTETVRLDEAMFIGLGVLNKAIGPRVCKHGFY